MHRVELKVTFAKCEKTFKHVPNAPCGVESNKVVNHIPLVGGFLMHRVELKGL